MNQEPKFTASAQDGEPGSCFLAQVFAPSGEAVAQFEPTSPPSIASSYARLLADVLNTPQQTDAKALAEKIKAAQPVGREALSRKAMVDLWGDKSDGPSNSEIIRFGRAVERAHGITGEGV